MTADQIRIEREAREAKAAERAATLPPGEHYHASDNHVAFYDRVDGICRVMECETHWDACLVLLAYGRLER